MTITSRSVVLASCGASESPVLRLGRHAGWRTASGSITGWPSGLQVDLSIVGESVEINTTTKSWCLRQAILFAISHNACVGVKHRNIEARIRASNFDSPTDDLCYSV